MILKVAPNPMKLAPYKSYHNERPTKYSATWTHLYIYNDFTVAGEATSKSIGSKIKLVVGAN